VVAFGTGVAAMLSVPLVVTVTAGPAGDVLLSKGHPVLASSTVSTDYLASRGVDDNLGSRWASVTAAGSQWLRIDLGAARKITRVKLTWEKAFASGYRVQTSPDAASWTDLYATRAGDGAVDDLKNLTGSGRYVRVLGTQRGTTFGYSLWEFQVYGPGPAGPVTESVPWGIGVPPAAATLADPGRKDIAMQLVSTAENSSKNWRAQYGYIEDIGDGRGYTGGIVGFCSGTSDMLAVVTEYTRRKPGNRLARFLPALRTVDGSDSHAGLGAAFTGAWRSASADPVFRKTQDDSRDQMYFGPAVTMARTDGLRALGQFAYYDAAVMHGQNGLRGIRADAMRTGARPPLWGGDEIAWLTAFLYAREREMRTEEAHSDTTRVGTAQRVFLKAGNLDLNTPLSWQVYGDRFKIDGP
jgi:chitosanase